MLDWRRRTGVAAGVVAIAAVGSGVALADPNGPASSSGPSSSQSPYVVPVADEVRTKSILTVGDSVGGYRMAGIPDGLGAFEDYGGKTFTLLMNHELVGTAGAVHDHGAKGSFVSKWTIDKDTLEVVKGDDLIKRVATWNTAIGKHNAPAAGVVISRLCSADLPDPKALRHGEFGYNGRIFLSGEEAGTEGRAFAHVVTGGEAGTSYELPALGKFSWENLLANPATGKKTVVVGLDDSTPGEVYVYEGDKKKTGNAAERSGLTGGMLGGIKVDGFATEPAATGIPSGTRFGLALFGDASSTTGAALQTASTSAGVTKFNRPEDGHWDPRDPSKFYFVTTDSFTGKSRLWRLNFEDPSNPSLGGTIDMLLDGTEGQKMMDNLTVDREGRVLIQEDPGNQAYLAKLHAYDITSDTLTTVAQHDPMRFDPAVASPLLTQDEESSGVIDASDILGKGWFLGDVQAHFANADPALVEGGQLFALYVPKK